MRSFSARTQHNKYEHVLAWMNEWMTARKDRDSFRQSYICFIRGFHLISHDLFIDERMNCFISSMVFSPIFMYIFEESICYLYQINLYTSSSSIHTRLTCSLQTKCSCRTRMNHWCEVGIWSRKKVHMRVLLVLAVTIWLLERCRQARRRFAE